MIDGPFFRASTNRPRSKNSLQTVGTINGKHSKTLVNGRVSTWLSEPANELLPLWTRLVPPFHVRLRVHRDYFVYFGIDSLYECVDFVGFISIRVAMLADKIAMSGPGLDAPKRF